MTAGVMWQKQEQGSLTGCYQSAVIPQPTFPITNALKEFSQHGSEDLLVNNEKQGKLNFS